MNENLKLQIENGYIDIDAYWEKEEFLLIVNSLKKIKKYELVVENIKYILETYTSVENMRDKMIKMIEELESGDSMSLTGKFLYKHPRANLTQTPLIIRNKSDIETIKELQQLNFKLQQENKRLKEEVQELKADYGNKAQVERDLLQMRIDNVLKILD